MKFYEKLLSEVYTFIICTYGAIFTKTLYYIRFHRGMKLYENLVDDICTCDILVVRSHDTDGQSYNNGFHLKKVQSYEKVV